jgi:hypothetical protein
MQNLQISAHPPNAWLLDFGQNVRAAVGKRVLLQLIKAPKVFSVPVTHDYCCNVILWGGRLLPVMDMAARLGGSTQEVKLLTVVGYQFHKNETVRFGALLLETAPVAISVTDAQACPLPVEQSCWGKFAISCFDHEGVPTPIIKMDEVFM